MDARLILLTLSPEGISFLIGQPRRSLGGAMQQWAGSSPNWEASFVQRRLRVVPSGPAVVALSVLACQAGCRRASL